MSNIKKAFGRGCTRPVNCDGVALAVRRRVLTEPNLLELLANLILEASSGDE